MPTALLHGEIHASGKDAAALQELDLDTFDAVFMEGIQYDHADRLRPGYVLLLVGFLLYKHVLQRLFYHSKDAFTATADSAGTPTHVVDATVWEWNQRIPFLKKTLVLIGSLFLSYTIIQPLFGNAGLLIGSTLILWPLLHFLYISLFTITERNTVMAENMQRLTEEHGYETVLVTVGDSHLSGLATQLEADSWNVEVKQSDSMFAYWTRTVQRPITRVASLLTRT